MGDCHRPWRSVAGRRAHCPAPSPALSRGRQPLEGGGPGRCPGGPRARAHGRPVPGPAYDLTICEVRDASLVLLWKAPLYAGGSPVSGYLVDYQEGDSGEWVTANQVATANRYLKVTFPAPLVPWEQSGRVAGEGGPLRVCGVTPRGSHGGGRPPLAPARWPWGPGDLRTCASSHGAGRQPRTPPAVPEDSGLCEHRLPCTRSTGVITIACAFPTCHMAADASPAGDTHTRTHART